MRLQILYLLPFFLFSCESEPDLGVAHNADPSRFKGKLFEARLAETTQLDFTNTVVETDTENYQSYFFIYNGAGVAVGDLNNDGLPDIYFAGNSSSDKLFINKGDLKFEDTSEAAGIEPFDGWSTGVSMVDINADGWLDIYVCRAGPSADVTKRTNGLFINNTDGTFSEQAQSYGLASTDYSAQSAFFDYDLDGDLDMYLLNHPPEQIGGKLGDHMQKVRSGERTTDVFLENVDGKFVNKSAEANLLNFGYRHGIAIGDVNADGYPDMYISSDSDDPDYFCINQQDKTFKNEVNSAFRHTSFNSMGNEMVDVNNDGLLDVFVLDMAPSDHFRSKAYMQSMDVERYRNLVKYGYHHQYMFNSLQINNGNGVFSEVAQFSEIAKTDWSWAPLFFDMDQDGLKDLFVTNGIKENFLYRDINVDAREKHGQGFSLNLEQLLDIVPSDISENIFYHNVDGVSFEDKSGEWAAPALNNSNGVATADFDNDGDLDFVVNNMDSKAILYENMANNGAGGNSVKLILKGKGKNTNAIGSRVEIISENGSQLQELHTSRGYLSSVDTPMVFGLGADEKVTVKVRWPDGSSSELNDVRANKTYTLEQSLASSMASDISINDPVMLTVSNPKGLSFTHREDSFDDYYEQILLPHSQSNVGPVIIKGDVNGDQLEDIFIGGAAGQPGAMFVQKSDGSFDGKNGDWAVHKDAEDTGAIFFDYDNDSDLDLYVVSGGAHLKHGHQFYQDRLYENDGAGNFRRRMDLMPKIDISGKAVVSSDIDGDGDMDLFVGGRVVPNRYPEAPKSYFLINNRGTFSLKEWEVGNMVSSALFSDYDGDGDEDLFTVGEWSAIKLYENNGGDFKELNLPSLDKTEGLWFSVAESDVDNDGDMDYFFGNLGLNTKFKANKKKEFHIYGNDFDNNGTYDVVLSGNYNGKLVPARGRECSSQQMPFIQEKFTDYKSFANASMEDIYGDELDEALHIQAHMLESMVIINNGPEGFELRKLPWQTQLSPITDFEFTDLNGDGLNEVMVVGNLYNVEVETQRYDASVGVVMEFNNGALEVIPSAKTGFYTTGDTRGIVSLSNGLIIVTNNNGSLDVFKFSESTTNTIAELSE